jgi:N utilization substance protein A
MMYQMSTGARTGKDAVGQDVVTTIRQMARERGLDLEALVGALEEALTAAERRARGGDEGVRVGLERETGEILVLERDPGAEGGWRPAGSRVGLGRVAAQAVRQAIRDGIRRREREAAVREYGGRIGETVVGVVSRPGPGSVLLDLGRAEGIIPAAEQVPGERHRRGERLRAVVVDVRPEGEGPEVVLSRRSEALVADLLRLEVPAVEDGLVEVRAIAREPGVRTKISVAARRPGVDPVGACIGPRGARIRRVVAELGGERVDVLRHEDEPARLVARALAPVPVREVLVDDEAREATVIVPDDEIAAAVGRSGVNVRLASRLAGLRVRIAPASALEGESQEAPEEIGGGRCGATLASGRRCVNAAIPGTGYCSLPAHAAQASSAA